MLRQAVHEGFLTIPLASTAILLRRQRRHRKGVQARCQLLGEQFVDQPLALQARLAGECRRGRPRWSLCHDPFGGGGGAEGTVQENPVPDR